MKKPAAATASTLPEIIFTTPEVINEFGEQVSSAIGRDGKEYPDPIPTAPPVGYTQPPDIMTMIRTMIQSEQVRQRLAQEDMETFEEADDFDIEDDPVDPLTEYEKVFLPPANPEPLPLNPATPAAAGGSQTTPPAVPARPPELLDNSGLADTSASNPKIQNVVNNPAAKAT